jgi:uroporphyrinogen decarboxylase
MRGRERFLAACRRAPVDRPPVWIMRQAGRYLPEYLALRADHPFTEVCSTPELALEVALQPLRRFALDATIVFSDILVIPDALGQRVEYPEGGPRLSPALGQDFDPDALAGDDERGVLAPVYEAISLLRDAVGDEQAVLGFAGAPFSLATYMIHGGSSRNHEQLKALMYRDPARAQALLSRLADTVADHLERQVAAGADAVQVFDTWAGVLSPDDYDRFALPATQRVMERLSHLDVIRILYVGGIAGIVEQAASAGADVLSVDWRVNLGDVARRVGDDVVLQGNLDPVELYGPPERIVARVGEIHRDLGRSTGHVFNLGHGILPTTPVDGAAAFVDAVAGLAEQG